MIAVSLGFLKHEWDIFVVVFFICTLTFEIPTLSSLGKFVLGGISNNSLSQATWLIHDLGFDLL